MKLFLTCNYYVFVHTQVLNKYCQKIWVELKISFQEDAKMLKLKKSIEKFKKQFVKKRVKVMDSPIKLNLYNILVPI